MDKPKLTDDMRRKYKDTQRIHTTGGVIADVYLLCDSADSLERSKETVLKSHYMLERQVEEMQKTLEWYADEENWHYDKSGDGLIGDGGDRARQTLESLKEEDNS